MKLTKEESQALAFIGGLILISAIARFAGRPGPVTIEGNQVSIAELQAGSMALMTRANAAAAGASLGWVNLNAASEAEIAAIPKVGPAAAALIVAERDRLGGVLQLDDVRAIRGLKKAALEAIAENGSFGTWDDPGRMTPPPGLSALQQPPGRKRGRAPPAPRPAGAPDSGRRSSPAPGARALPPRRRQPWYGGPHPRAARPPSSSPSTKPRPKSCSACRGSAPRWPRASSRTANSTGLSGPCRIAMRAAGSGRRC